MFARCAGFIFRAPGFSHPSVPAAVRAGLAYAIGLALSRRYAVDFHGSAASFVLAAGSELLIGAAIGFAASMLYDGAYSGGRALDDYVGIRASVPSASIVAPSGFGRLWSLAFTTAFFVLGAYRVAFAGFGHTFETLPPGAAVAGDDLLAFAVALPLTLARAALFVAGPAIAAVLLAQLALAGISRVVPRLSTFLLSFPIVFACAVIATLAGLPAVTGAAAAPWFDLSALRAAHTR